MNLDKKTILITGGAGCIGSNLTRALLSRARLIVVLDDLSSSEQWNVPQDPRVKFVEGDVCQDDVLAEVFSYRPEVVFHLAALFANQNSIEHPRDDLRVNGLGSLKVLQHAQMARVERFVFASSGCSVYGAGAPLPVTEDFISLELDTPYQITKLLGELYCNYFHHYMRIPVVRARFFNVFGPGEIPGRYRNVIPNFVYRALLGKVLTITGTGEETRDFTYVDDIVAGVLACAENDGAVGQAFNLASGRETRVIDLARTINAQTGNGAGIEFAGSRDWDRITRRCASVEKARRLLGYHPRTGMRKGLRNVIAWTRANLDRLEQAMRISSRTGSPDLVAAQPAKALKISA
jgi:nucleoside-diphosphate-sugar epimerase